MPLAGTARIHLRWSHAPSRILDPDRTESRTYPHSIPGARRTIRGVPDTTFLIRIARMEIPIIGNGPALQFRSNRQVDASPRPAWHAEATDRYRSITLIMPSGVDQKNG